MMSVPHCLQCGDRYEPSEDGYLFCSLGCEEQWEDEHEEEL